MKWFLFGAVALSLLALSDLLTGHAPLAWVRPERARPTPAPAPVEPPCPFEEAAERAGVRFTHRNGDTDPPERFVEFAPGGCAFLDYDGDGYLDILLIQSGSPEPDAAHPPCGLYRNNRDGTFTDASRGSGLDRDLGYLIGGAVADVNNDGLPDLLLTGFRANRLFLNTGRDTPRFREATRQWGLHRLHSTGFATSAAFGDYNNDGRLDLYICYYSDWTWGKDGERYRNTLHHPDTHKLYRNDGNRFTDVSGPSGIAAARGRGLAVGFLDYNGDGLQDIFVANDQTPHMLWRNQGDGTFLNVAPEAGCARSADGQLMAGMCVTMADYDHSGRQSIFVTNRVDSPNALFTNVGDGLFEDRAVPVGVAALPAFSFGAEFLDYDNDGWADLLVVNGMINDQNLREVARLAAPQRKLLYHNARNGTLRERTSPQGLGPLAAKTVARGLAIGDYDNDGRVDALVSNQNQPVELFHNRDRNGHHRVVFQTIGTKSNRDGLHARFTVTAGGMTQTAVVRAGSSYLSASDRRVHFGLGAATRIDTVVIRWPSGTVDRLEAVEPDALYTVTEGQGITGKRPFPPPSTE